MGRARITKNLGNGQYDIAYEFDTEAIDQEKSSINLRLSALPGILVELDNNRNQAQQDIDSLLVDLDDLIVAEGGELTPAFIKAVASLQGQVLEVRQILAAIDVEKSLIESEKVGLNKRLNLLSSLESQVTVEGVWCADKTEQIAGSTLVGTLEVPGDLRNIQIKPGGGGEGEEAAYKSGTDGLAAHAFGMTPSSMFYNLALLPGWQKFRPLFRYARIKQILNEKVNLELIEPLLSDTLVEPDSLLLRQAPGVDITPTHIDDEVVELDDVEVEYLTCGVGAFLVGDIVVVRLDRDTQTAIITPLVIGFKENPRGCGLTFYTQRGSFAIGLLDNTPGTQAAGFRYGNQDWRNAASQTAVSWGLRGGRSIALEMYRQTVGGPVVNTLTDEVFRDGKILALAPGPVLGAGLRSDPITGVSYLYVAVAELDFGDVSVSGIQIPLIPSETTFYRKELGTAVPIFQGWQDLGTILEKQINLGNRVGTRRNWRFDINCSKAVVAVEDRVFPFPSSPAPLQLGITIQQVDFNATTGVVDNHFSLTSDTDIMDADYDLITGELKFLRFSQENITLQVGQGNPVAMNDAALIWADIRFDAFILYHTSGTVVLWAGQEFVFLGSIGGITGTVPELMVGGVTDQINYPIDFFLMEAELFPTALSFNLLHHKVPFFNLTRPLVLDPFDPSLWQHGFSLDHEIQNMCWAQVERTGGLSVVIHKPARYENLGSAIDSELAFHFRVPFFGSGGGSAAQMAKGIGVG